MHRTQLKKKKNRIKDFSSLFFLSFLLFLDVWEEMWVQSELCQIIK
jgi:hypothetical protein